MMKAHSVLVGYIHTQTGIKIVAITPVNVSGIVSKKKFLFTCEDKTTFVVDFNAMVPFRKPD